ncbi:MAG: hypothetical protein M9962_02405 [Oligoflexia bacterium]|nr:hypothetical protein [Oligoflexia bacterium]
MRFLFFSPYQAIAKHVYPERFIAEILMNSAHEVSYLGCNRFLSKFCISHAAFSLKENSTKQEREKVCAECINNRNQISDSSIPFFYLDDYYDQSEDQNIREILNALKKEEIYNLKFRDYCIGQTSSYEFILNHKISDMSQISEEQFNYYKIYLENSIRAVISFERFFSSNKFDKIFVYNSGYSINSALCEVAKKFNIPVFFMHAGLNLYHMLDSLYFSPSNIIDYNIKSIKFFVDNAQELSLDYAKYRLVLDHFKSSFKSTSVFSYSSARKASNFSSLCKKIFKNKKYKKVVLLSMSSSDETYGADFAIMKFTYVKNATKIFSNQIEWVKNTIDFFSKHPEYLLIIRIHPREFPNKREKVMSSRIAEYEKIFRDLPENIYLDHPEEGNSIYDLFEIADLQITAQTTAGIEGAMLGIPLISTVQRLGMYPIPAIALLPKSVEEYEKTILESLREEKDTSKSLMMVALKWYLYLHTELQFNFDSKNFWLKEDKRSLINRGIKKVKRFLKIPKYSLSKYLKSTSISDEEKPYLLKILESISMEKEIYTFREDRILNSDSRSSVNEEAYFYKYLLGLFSLLYGVDIAEYAEFKFLMNVDMPKSLQEKECIFLVSEKSKEFEWHRNNGGSVFVIPEKANLAISLAKLISGQ